MVHNDIFGKEMPELSYMSHSSVTHCYSRTKTYGGKLTENIVQAVARDILVHSMKVLTDEGFDIVATVHDEVIIEGRDLNLECVESLMTSVPWWCEGLPLTAEGFKARRFRK